VTNLLVSGGLGLVILDFFYTWCRNKYNVCLLDKTVERGTENFFKTFYNFQPYEDQLFYHVICGGTGPGKSNKVEHGVIYVDTLMNLEVP
jgi:hypothetical protein